MHFFNQKVAMQALLMLHSVVWFYTLQAPGDGDKKDGKWSFKEIHFGLKHLCI